VIRAVRTFTGAGSLVVLAHGAWWTVLALSAMRRPHPLPPSTRPWRFVVVVPAHDEERLVGACVRSLLAAPFTPQPEVVVVADNCTDATAAVARDAGATVLVRDDKARRGKSYALEFALEHLRSRTEQCDAVAVVDADSEVSPDFFTALAARFESGAQAVQVHYVADRGDAPLARLRRLSFLLVHWTRPLGASRLGLGTTLKGNGMALRREVAAAGLGGGGITEDAAMTLALARRGVAVAFEPGATVRGHMASDYVSARVQDERWEGGRFALLPESLSTAIAALQNGDRATAAAAFELATLPLSLVALLATGGVVAGAVGLAPRRLAGVAFGSVVAGVVGGLIAARAPLADVIALAYAPRFVLHKARIYGRIIVGRSATTWERTAR
jgi:hypothetical protein